MHTTSPITDTYIPGVTVTEAPGESGSGLYDVTDHGSHLGHIYVHMGQWYGNPKGRAATGPFLRSKDAVNDMVLANRYL